MSERRVRKANGSTTVLRDGQIVGNLPSGRTMNPTSGTDLGAEGLPAASNESSTPGVDQLYGLYTAQNTPPANAARPEPGLSPQDALALSSSEDPRDRKKAVESGALPVSRMVEMLREERGWFVRDVLLERALKDESDELIRAIYASGDDEIVRTTVAGTFARDARGNWRDPKEPLHESVYLHHHGTTVESKRSRERVEEGLAILARSENPSHRLYAAAASVSISTVKSLRKDEDERVRAMARANPYSTRWASVDFFGKRVQRSAEGVFDTAGDWAHGDGVAPWDDQNPPRL